MRFPAFDESEFFFFFFFRSVTQYYVGIRRGRFKMATGRMNVRTPIVIREFLELVTTAQVRFLLAQTVRFTRCDALLARARCQL
jgi:hypothetical protein